MQNSLNKHKNCVVDSKEDYTFDLGVEELSFTLDSKLTVKRTVIKLISRMKPTKNVTSKHKTAA